MSIPTSTLAPRPAGLVQIGRESAGLTVAGLFAGIGGIELGLKAAGHRTQLLCEIDPGASQVLRERFGINPHPDITKLKSLGSVDLVAAGFPCQDLSQAGAKRGISGSQSGLVDHMFSLLRKAKRRGAPPEWILIENVSYMRRLEKGRALLHLTTQLERLGYTWAYRVVDARWFGVPQRRQRVVMLAARSHDPRPVLFADSVQLPSTIDRIGEVRQDASYGFYWTEGSRGLGWAEDAVPTIKGGSRVGIPSPPAVWTPSDGFIGTPELEDVERLQGFEPGWTAAADVAYDRPRRQRWTLVGNAVCVPMAEWVGRRLSEPGRFDESLQKPMGDARWPVAAWGSKGERFEVNVGMRPFEGTPTPLLAYLQHPLRPLSHRAASGFLRRAESSRLRFSNGFLQAVGMHRDGMVRPAA